MKKEIIRRNESFAELTRCVSCSVHDVTQMPDTRENTFTVDVLNVATVADNNRR